MTRRELVAYLGFKTDDKPLKDIQNQLEGIKQKLEFLTAVEVLKGLYEMTERFTKFAEELHVASEAAGLTVEEFQKLAFAASKSAVSQEELGTGLARLTRHLYEARRGSAEAIKAFTDVGIGPGQIASFKTGADAMLAISQRFTQFDDKVKKAALTTQLFGRGSVNLVSFLNQGPGAIRGLGVEAEKLGAVLSGKQVEALVKTEHALTSLFAVFKAFGASIAAYIAPSIEDAVNSFLKFYEVNRKILEINVQEWLYDVGFALGYAWGAIQALVQAFLNFAETHQKLIKRIGELVLALGGLGIALFVITKAASIVQAVFSPLTSIIIAVAKAFWSLSAALAANPVILAYAAGIGLLVLVLHDLYTVLTGGKWEDTWLFKTLNAVKGLGTGAFGLLKSWLEPDFGKYTDDKSPQKNIGIQSNLNAAQNLSALSGLIATPSFGSNSVVGGSQQYSVNAPITVNVPPNTDPKAVGEKVQEAITGHLDTVYRRTQNSLRPSVAY